MEIDDSWWYRHAHLMGKYQPIARIIPRIRTLYPWTRTKSTEGPVKNKAVCQPHSHLPSISAPSHPTGIRFHSFRSREVVGSTLIVGPASPAPSALTFLWMDRLLTRQAMDNGSRIRRRTYVYYRCSLRSCGHGDMAFFSIEIWVLTAAGGERGLGFPAFSWPITHEYVQQPCSVGPLKNQSRTSYSNSSCMSMNNLCYLTTFVTDLCSTQAVSSWRGNKGDRSSRWIVKSIAIERCPFHGIFKTHASMRKIRLTYWWMGYLTPMRWGNDTPIGHVPCFHGPWSYTLYMGIAVLSTHTQGVMQREHDGNVGDALIGQ